MQLPDFVVQCGQDENGKHHAFYIDPIDKSEMRGPARDTEEEAVADGREVLAMFAGIATKNRLIVGDGKKH